MNKVVNAVDISFLKAKIQGDVFLEGEKGYDDSRKAWNLLMVQKPLLIIEPKNIEDVQNAVLFANEKKLKISVQSTGHGTLNESTGAILIKTSKLTEIAIDLQEQTATVGAGIKGIDILAVTEDLGLAPLTGLAPTVGIIGFTLNGGFGWLTRKYGLASESLLEVKMVNTNGELLTINEINHPELFWALKGGGPQFGIVTSIKVKLFPVSKVNAGQFIFPIERAEEILLAYRQWTLSLPREVSSIFIVHHFPDIPQIPFPIRGKHVIIIVGCSLDESETNVFEQLEKLDPILSEIKNIHYNEMASFMNEPIDPFKFYAETKSFDTISEDLIKILAHSLTTDPNAESMVLEFRHLGGVLGDNLESDSIIKTNAQAILSIIIGLSPNENYMDGKQKATKLIENLQKLEAETIFPNFLYYGDNMERVKKSYEEEIIKKLIKIKEAYDPEGRILSNLNLKSNKGVSYE